MNTTKELFDNLEQLKIGLDDPFYFKCRSCGKCCKNREDILLSPHDLFQIAKHFGKTVQTIAEEYCHCYIGQNSRFPIIRLRPRGVNNACPFLVDKKCQIHACKPAVCALFPLGRFLLAKEPQGNEPLEYTAGYILQSTECGSRKKSNTVRQWLEKFDVPVDDPFYTEWNMFRGDTSITLRKLEETITEQLFVDLQNALIELLYIQYNTAEEFLPQFSKRVARAKELVHSLQPHLQGGGDDSET